MLTQSECNNINTSVLEIFSEHIRSCCINAGLKVSVHSDSELLLTAPLRPRLNKRAPLSRHFGESSHSELVECAAVQCCHIFGGLVPIICVHPRVKAPLADWLVLYDVFNDASIGILRGLPPHLNG